MTHSAGTDSLQRGKKKAIRAHIGKASKKEIVKIFQWIVDGQTEDEQRNKSATVENERGFDMREAASDFVNDMIELLKKNGSPTDNQIEGLRKICANHARQLLKFNFYSEEEIAAFATENDFKEIIGELITTGISKESITTEMERLGNEQRNSRYIKKYLLDWISRIKEEKAVSELKDKNPLDYFFRDLEKTVKQDTIAKLCCICTCTSTYTENPLNSFLKAESSIGKTHGITQTANYFPDEDVWFLGGLSPTAIVHESGTWLDEEGQEIKFGDRPAEPKLKDYEDKETWQHARQQYLQQIGEWNERIKNGYKLVDLSNKLLIFMEAPHPDTIRKLYPILSHDKKEITFKITDKNLRGQLQTITARIRGYPATIICATGRVKTVEETLTRFLTISPVASAAKFKEANELTNKIFSEGWKYKTKSEEQKNIEFYLKAVRRKLIDENADISIPFDLAHIFPYAQGGDMRHFKHFMQLVQALTALNIFDRPRIEMNEENYYLSNAEDVATALMIYSKIAETTKTGKEKAILDFYHGYLEIQDAEFDLKRITELYNIAHNRKLNRETVRTKIVSELVSIDYLDQVENPNDKRLNTYIPIKFSAEETDKETNDNKLTINSHISNIRLILLPELEKSFKEWIKNNIRKNDSVTEKKNKTIEDSIKKVCYINENFLRLSYISGELSNDAEEAENSHKEKTWQSKANSEKNQPGDNSNHDEPKDTQETTEENNNTKTKFGCICGEYFASGELLREHQAKCDGFQQAQTRVAK